MKIILFLFIFVIPIIFGILVIITIRDRIIKNWANRVTIKKRSDLYFIKFNLEKIGIPFYPKLKGKRINFDTYEKAVNWIGNNKKTYGPIVNINSIKDDITEDYKPF